MGISQLMHNIQGSRFPIQDLADKVASCFTPVILVLGLVTFLVWILVGKLVQDRMVGKAGINVLMKMITVLVVSCLCVISLCALMVVIIAVSVAAKKGVVFKWVISSSLSHLISSTLTYTL